MLQINKKLKQAREMVGLTQQQLAEWMQISAHSVISAYEKGTKKGISEQYLEFMITNKFDLNTLFDNSKELKQLPEEGENRYKQLETVTNYFTEPAEASKDKYVALLQQQVDMLSSDKVELQKTIDELQEQLRFMRSNTNGRAKSA
jgi:DNA-binding XRE family transcriptional regulator